VTMVHVLTIVPIMIVFPICSQGQKYINLFNRHYGSARKVVGASMRAKDLAKASGLENLCRTP